MIQDTRAHGCTRVFGDFLRSGQEHKSSHKKRIILAPRTALKPYDEFVLCSLSPLFFASISAILCLVAAEICRLIYTFESVKARTFETTRILCNQILVKMKVLLKKVVSVYFKSWWLPFVTAFCTLLLFLITGIITIVHSDSRFVRLLGGGLLNLLILTLLGILVAAIWNLIRKRWARGIVSLLVMFPLSIAMSLVGFGFLSITSFFGPSEDGFGKDIVIPPEMKLEEPGQLPDNETRGSAEDPEGRELIGIFSNSRLWPTESMIDTNVPVLNEFVGDKRMLLMRHLATSAKWCLTRDHGKVTAFRRFVTGKGRWETSLNGYYTDFDWERFGRDRVSFQVKVVIGVDGQVMRQTPIIRPIVLDVGSGKLMLKAKDALGWPGNETHLVLRSAGSTVEIVEIAETMMRPFTTLALEQIQSELNALLNSETARDKGFDLSLMPPHSVHRGKPGIWILDGKQGGIYLVDAYVNPGESGYTYLKVFEATKNTRLSEDRITQYSTEYVGWSDDPEELFFYHTLITVYEGDWGVYYPARFELWFVPASGEPERKLVEEVFKIEGWQR
jgi:hypothetical protein